MTLINVSMVPSCLRCNELHDTTAYGDLICRNFDLRSPLSHWHGVLSGMRKPLIASLRDDASDRVNGLGHEVRVHQARPTHMQLA